ncbi:MAG TPA: peptidylprolyl isomerase [Anaerolineales bacterium]|nr:peptidylprolyl isomerase [Anaerolineales bacterium]
MAKQSPTQKAVTKKHMARLERERRQANIIRGIAIAGILIVLFLLGYGYLNVNVLQLREPVAEVNGEEITTREWQERVQLQRVNLLNLYQTYQFYQQSFGMDTTQQLQEIQITLQSPELLGQDVLDQMIDEVLIRQEAERRGISVSEEEVEAAVRAAYGFFPDGTPTPTITPTEFSLPTLSAQQLTVYPSTATPTAVLTSTPASTNTPNSAVTATPTSTTAPPTPTFVPQEPTATATPFTLEGFNTQYGETLANFEDAGISEATLRAAYENQLLREKLQEEVTTDTPRSEEQVWARHILVADLGEARSILAQLQHGADFAELAREHSTDTGSGAKGGDLGWFGRGAMVAEFEETAFSLEIGEISEPVQSQFGYHIIQVLGHDNIPLNATEYQEKRQTAFTEWLAQAREEADITIYDIWRERVPPAPASLSQPIPQ